MKLLLIVDTPNDDSVHWKHIHRALDLYMSRIRANNNDSFSAKDNIGLDGGPNTLDCGGDVFVHEQRIDTEHFKWKIYERLPKCIRGAYAKIAWAA